MCSAKKVDMISVHAHCFHLNLISLFYTCRCLPDYLNNLFVEKNREEIYADIAAWITTRSTPR